MTTPDGTLEHEALELGAPVLGRRDRPAQRRVDLRRAHPRRGIDIQRVWDPIGVEAIVGPPALDEHVRQLARRRRAREEEAIADDRDGERMSETTFVETRIP